MMFPALSYSRCGLLTFLFVPCLPSSASFALSQRKEDNDENSRANGQEEQKEGIAERETITTKKNTNYLSFCFWARGGEGRVFLRPKPREQARA